MQSGTTFILLIAFIVFCWILSGKPRKTRNQITNELVPVLYTNIRAKLARQRKELTQHSIIVSNRTDQTYSFSIDNHAYKP